MFHIGKSVHLAWKKKSRFAKDCAFISNSDGMVISDGMLLNLKEFLNKYSVSDLGGL